MRSGRGGGEGGSWRREAPPPGTRGGGSLRPRPARDGTGPGDAPSPPPGLGPKRARPPGGEGASPSR
uniref:Uncharacterized protein n=1 Tax=Rangifer tarandus platyrhynchus TaxID=3082113 RepID=A0ACB0E2V3_RANTA|nr:unnamed protein product [Rangifer tarandus platyrhynchus]